MRHLTKAGRRKNINIKIVATQNPALGLFLMACGLVGLTMQTSRIARLYLFFACMINPHLSIDSDCYLGSGVGAVGISNSLSCGGFGY
ncbi:hypothetical protein [Providencia stuartii]|uniref:hypothetical protein n=2 Tax=Providencia TaxID=586 RepID=UPI00197E533A|nr:hypothetical protein [Providencia stuartii]MBN4867626.1 hypothetical protein [Providencia stuartii]MBN4877137.1 hypothetical protein [Providencia stuartii]MBN4881646.1 hypothetical protein [Providencia stuartii]MBN4886141.1 hypothetical protein [Providencia stuartii]